MSLIPGRQGAYGMFFDIYILLTLVLSPLSHPAGALHTLNISTNMPLYLRNRLQAYTELWQPMVYGVWCKFLTNEWYFSRQLANSAARFKDFIQNLSFSLHRARSRGFATWYSRLGLYTHLSISTNSFIR